MPGVRRVAGKDAPPAMAPALSTFLAEMARFQDGTQHAAGDDAETAKVAFTLAILRLAQAHGAASDLPDETVAAAVRTNSLPIWRSTFHLLDLASDPAALEFPGNYDHWLKVDFHDLAGPAEPEIVALLLAGGLLKFMGRFDDAARLYETLTRSDLARAHGAIGLGDLHLVASLYEAHMVGHADHWPYPPHAAAPFLGGVLRWSRPTGFAEAEQQFGAAVALRPDLAWAHYARAVHRRAIGQREAAAESYAVAAKHAAPGARDALAAQAERHGRVDLPLLETPEPQGALVGVLASEAVSTRYVVHDPSGSRTVARTPQSRPLQAQRVVDAWPMTPSLNAIRVGDTLLADTIMFTGRERAMWEPSLAAFDAGRAAYAKAAPTPCDDPVILLGGMGSFYYHFLFDVMGALSVVPQPLWDRREIIFSDFQSATGEPSRWQREILSMMGIPRARLHKGETFYRDAVVASYPSQDNRVAPGVVRFLRERLAQPRRADRANRIFFGRSAGRTVASASATLLRTVAEQHGFRCIDPLKLTVRQQRDLLSTCGVFMCEAGSGLANMIFLPEGAEVITLAAALTFKDYFCPVASTLGMHMHVVLSGIESIYPRHEFHWCAFNPTVDEAALRRCMQAVLGPPRTRARTRAA